MNTQQQYDPNSFLTGGGVKSAFGKDDPLGLEVTGTICEDPEVRQQTDLQSGAPLTWDNGDPKLQLVVTLQTSLRDDDEDDGRRRIYVKGSKAPGSRSVHDAVATAVRNAGAKGLELGGTLTMRYVGTEPSSTRGFNDRKLWEASYTPPDKAAATGEFLGTGQVNITTGEVTQQAPAQPQQAAQAPAAPAATQGPSAAQIAALRAAGLDDEGIRKVYPTYQPV